MGSGFVFARRSIRCVRGLPRGSLSIYLSSLRCSVGRGPARRCYTGDTSGDCGVLRLPYACLGVWVTLRAVGLPRTVVGNAWGALGLALAVWGLAASLGAL
jgi:hypothetical protein